MSSDYLKNKKACAAQALKRLCVICSIVIWVCLCAFVERKDFPQLKDVLENGTFVEQINALTKIRRSGLKPEDVRSLLEPARTNPDVRIRFFALQILYESGYADMFTVLSEYITDPYEKRNVKLRALSTIEALRDDTLIPGLVPLFDEIQDDAVTVALLCVLIRRGALGAYAERIVPVCKKYLQSGNAHTKITILDMLAQQDARVVPLVTLGLEDADARVCDAAFDALVSLGGVSVQNLIRPYLTSEQPHIRYNAAFALTALGEENYLRFIETDLSNEDATVRLTAIRFLAKKAERGRVDRFMPVMKRLARQDSSEKVRAEAERYMEKAKQIQQMLRL